MTETYEIRMERERIQRQQACQNRAERRLASLIESTKEGADEPFSVRGDIHAKEVGRIESYMTDGNGPTAYLCFVFDAEDDLNYGFFKFFDGGEEAIVPIGQWRTEELYALCRQYKS